MAGSTPASILASFTILILTEMINIELKEVRMDKMEICPIKKLLTATLTVIVAVGASLVAAGCSLPFPLREAD